MTYRELLHKAQRQLEHNEITLGEYEEMIKPLTTEVRKVGKWIKIGDRGFGYSDTVICKCSECEYKAEFTGKFSEGKLVVDMERAYNYCPNCGAEMRG